MGSGPCRRCDECDTSGPFLQAYKARPFMETCWIDVFKAAREYNLPVRVIRTREEERDIFRVVLVE